MTSLALSADSVLPHDVPVFERVLFGIDFTPASLSAARWAASHIAHAADAILSHVVPFPDAFGETPAERRLHARSVRELIPALSGGLGGFAATLNTESTRLLLRVGRPSRWLGMLANAADASLVVLGRRRDTNRVRVGEPNVLERVARSTQASVLVVPEGITNAPSHIVAAIDESAAGNRVVHFARLLAERHGWALTILHVMSPVIGAYDRVIGRARRSAVSADVKKVGDVTVVMGDPAREIATVATQLGSSLIVVGRNGADAAPPRSLGSVARELMTRANAPVLMVATE